MACAGATREAERAGTPAIRLTTTSTAGTRMANASNGTTGVLSEPISVAWQATSIGLAALVIGLPVGVAAGRWAWNTVATEIGSESPPVLPLLALAVLVPAVLVVVNLIAGVPARSASRVAPAQAMRAE